MMRMTQQIEVSATHQLQAAAAEPDGPIAQIVRLPSRPSCSGRFAEQALGNDAVRVASQAPIERAERKYESSTLLERQRPLWSATGPAHGGAPQMQRRIGARGEIGVQRNHNGRRCRSVCTADEHNGQTATTVIDEPMLISGSLAREYRRQGANRARIRERLWSRCNEHGAGIEMRQPDYRRAICLKIRIDREIAAPIAGSPPRKFQAARRSRRRRSDNRADMRDCGAGTPMRVRSDRGRSNTHRRPQTAILVPLAYWFPRNIRSGLEDSSQPSKP